MQPLCLPFGALCRPPAEAERAEFQLKGGFQLVHSPPSNARLRKSGFKAPNTHYQLSPIFATYYLYQLFSIFTCLTLCSLFPLFFPFYFHVYSLCLFFFTDRAYMMTCHAVLTFSLFFIFLLLANDICDYLSLNFDICQNSSSEECC